MADGWFNTLDARHANLRADGLLRELKLRRPDVVSFASNDYLGLSAHPLVVAAAKAALDEYGAGATASPLICGFTKIHDELARALAAFKGAERALVFPSGYQAALATLAGRLQDSETTILLDKLAHASLIGFGAKLFRARACARSITTIPAILRGFLSGRTRGAASWSLNRCIRWTATPRR